MDSDSVLTTLVVLFIIALFTVPVVIGLHGFHYNTGSGQHTGYVTAIEQNGVFFKTWTAYVKTDTQSSQEDTYCVIDPSVVNDLTHAVDTKEHVTVKYFSWLAAGVANCNGGEDDIISAVVAVP